MIRHYQIGDHHEIGRIFRDAVHQIASDVYTSQQCLAWCDKELNPNHWKKRCDLKKPYVYIKNDEIIGFIELDTNAHIDCIYVKSKYKRQGIASKLVNHVVEIYFSCGINRVFVEASICAKPMFEKLGFAVIHDKMINVKGQMLKNYDMEHLNNFKDQKTT